jgi:hypothetical protein
MNGQWIGSPLVGINEELKTIEAASAALSTNPNGKETIKVLRQAKYIAALAMTAGSSSRRHGC